MTDWNIDELIVAARLVQSLRARTQSKKIELMNEWTNDEPIAVAPPAPRLRCVLGRWEITQPGLSS